MTSSSTPDTDDEPLCIFTSMRCFFSTGMMGDLLYLIGAPNRGQTSMEIFYMFDYHCDRLKAAARQFHLLDALAYVEDRPRFERDIITALHEQYGGQDIPKDTKVRVQLSESAQLSVTLAPIPPNPHVLLYPHISDLAPRNPPTWAFYIAASKTTPSIFTKHKTTLRIDYDEARMNLPESVMSDGVERTSEVLLYNELNEMMEGSITSLYFCRRGEWVTPAEGCGGNKGTSRRLALERRLAREGIVRKESLELAEVVWCSNAVRGFGWGFIEGFLEDILKEQGRVESAGDKGKKPEPLGGGLEGGTLVGGKEERT